MTAYIVNIYEEGGDTLPENPDESYRYENISDALIRMLAEAGDRYKVRKLSFWTVAGPNSNQDMFAIYEPGQPGNIVLIRDNE